MKLAHFWQQETFQGNLAAIDLIDVATLSRQRIKACWKFVRTRGVPGDEPLAHLGPIHAHER